MNTIAIDIHNLTEEQNQQILRQSWPRPKTLSKAKIVGPNGLTQSYLFVGEDIYPELMETGREIWDKESDPDGVWKSRESEIRQWDMLGYRSPAEWLIAVCAAGWNARPASEKEQRDFMLEWQP
jgi:hypothetical protein